MKKYTRIAYIALILIVLLSGFFMYKVLGKNNSSEKLEEKTLSELKYFENEFQKLFNQFNNISFENYKISATEISTSKQSSTDSKSETSEKSESTEKSENSETSKDNKQYELEEISVLNKDTEIDWKQIKNDVEKIYSSLYQMTLDLYQTTTNQQDISNFSREFDNLIQSAKEEDKEKCLDELSILYDYIDKFAQNCTAEEKEKTILKTKKYIFKAYTILDKEEWEEINNNINSAIQEFKKITTDTSNKENRNQYNINKAYIMINELQNAVSLKDKEVFLIKYKNLLEELQNI